MGAAVDKDTCIGCGLCTSICGEVFELGDDGRSQVKEDADTGLDCVVEAADQCPVEAIELS